MGENQMGVDLGRLRFGRDYVGRLWPNGEFGLGKQKMSSLAVENEPLGYQAFENPKSPEIMAYACRQALRQAWCDRTGQSIPSLGLSPHTNSHKREKRGLKGISSFGRKMVRNGAWMLQRMHGKRHLSFLTLTLPSVSQEEGEVLAREWSEVVRRFVQRLTRMLRKAGLPGEVVGVTEIQEERTERDLVLGLHLHLVFVGRGRYRGWAYSWLDYRAAWKIEMDRVLGRDVDCSACENVERIHKDAEQYLGKYMSKGARSLKALVERGWGEILPSAWWIMSLSLKARVKRGVQYLSGQRADLIVRLCEVGAEVFLYFKKVTIVLKDGSERDIGWFGKVQRPFIASLYG